MTIPLARADSKQRKTRSSPSFAPLLALFLEVLEMSEGKTGTSPFWNPHLVCLSFLKGHVVTL